MHACLSVGLRMSIGMNECMACMYACMHACTSGEGNCFLGNDRTRGSVAVEAKSGDAKRRLDVFAKRSPVPCKCGTYVLAIA